MTTLPTYSRSGFQRATASDLVNLWKDCGSDAIYRVQGQGAGVLVRVYVSEKAPAMVKPPVFQAGGQATATQKKLWLCALIMEKGTAYSAEGAGGGVGLDGGIAALSRGDTFEVAGVVTGRPGEATVLIKIGAMVHTVNGVQWVAEVGP